MARTFTDLGLFPSLNHYYSSQIQGSGSLLQTELLRQRDAIRASLDPGTTGLTWSVSDIVKWQGSNANNFGYLFQIIHKDGAGVPTGHVWTWFYVLPENAEQYPTIGKTMMLNNQATFDQYVKRCGNNINWISDDYTPIIFYTPDYNREGRFTGTESNPPTLGTWQLQGDPTIHGIITADNGGGDWTLRLDGGRRLRATDVIEDSMGETLTISGITYDHCYDTGFANHILGTVTTGDWLDLPGSNPYSAWTDFWMESPQTPQMKGIDFEGNWGLNDRSYAWDLGIVSDDDEPFLAFYMTVTGHPFIATFCVMGDIIEPANAGDTLGQGVYYGTINISITDYYVYGHWAMWLYGDHPAGTPGSAAIDGANVRTIDRWTNRNERNASGEYLSDIATTDNANEMKGKFKETCIRTFGAWNTNGVVIEQGTNAFLRVARNIGLPFVVGEAQWPSGLRFQNRTPIANIKPLS